MTPVMLASPTKLGERNHTMVVNTKIFALDTKLAAVETPTVATFKMNGLKKQITVTA